MKREDLLNYASDPTTIISPMVCDELLFWASSYLTEYEEALAEIDLRVSQRRLVLINDHGSVAKAEAYLEIDPLYQEQQKIERRIRELRAFRSNVRRRYEILVNKELRKY